MKIAFYVADQNPSRDRSLGITGYTDGLLRSLSERGDINLVTIGSRTSYAPSVRTESLQLPFATDQSIGRIAADNLHPLLCQPAADMWHYPKGHLPLGWRPRKPVVGTVHDLIAQYCADHYPGARCSLAYDYWIWVLKRSIPRFDRILTVSKFSEVAIAEFCDRYRLKCPPISVSYEGCHLERPAISPAEKTDVVIHLSSLESYKRTFTVLAFWKRLQAIESNLPRLKLIGPLLESDRKAAEGLGGVEHCGRLPRIELEAEIASARALLFFSEIEGFGLPALEAYLLGTPALYVRGTAVQEVLGHGSAGGFSLASFESFRAALDEVLQIGAERIAVKAQQLRQRFAWSVCAERTLAVYRSVL